MFFVMFEAKPAPGRWDDYVALDASLRTMLEEVDGFVENDQYRSLTRDGWISSISAWRDEKAVVRWRTKKLHHEVQEKARAELLEEYHLRVGEVTDDTHLPSGYQLLQQRLDETEVGEGKSVTIIAASRPGNWIETKNPYDCAEWLGFNPWCKGCASWDIYESLTNPGDLILAVVWIDQESAAGFEDEMVFLEGSRIRRVRVVRDYGKFDRREAPGYFPDIEQVPARA